MPIILIVDDNPADVELLRDAFADLRIPADFLVASDGDEALDLLARIRAAEAKPPTAILLDLNMPRVTGREVLAHVKGDSELSRIPTIILTSSSSPKDQAECLAMGADAYFTKPSTLEELEELVHRVQGIVTKGPGTTLFAALFAATVRGAMAGLRAVQARLRAAARGLWPGVPAAPLR